MSDYLSYFGWNSIEILNRVDFLKSYTTMLPDYIQANTVFDIAYSKNGTVV